MHPLGSSVVKMLHKILSDTPDNEPIFFSAMRRRGRFWVDDVEHPSALLVCSNGKAPVVYLRRLAGPAEPDWVRIFRDLRPDGPLCGPEALVVPLADKLRFAPPTLETILAQRGVLRPTQVLAQPITRYDPELFWDVDRNAPWLWDAHGSCRDALEVFPAYGLIENGRIAALAMVGSHSAAWASLGYWVHPDHRRQGLATRCAAALTAHVNRQRLSVTASTEPTHAASLGVMRKIGLHEYAQVAFASPKAKRRSNRSL